MELSPPGWADPDDTRDLHRKLAACERVANIAELLEGHDLPLRKGINGPPSGEVEVMPMAVFDEFGRATKTFRAVIHLAGIGFGQQAQILAGIVIQSSLVTIWAIQKGESVDKMADLHARYGAQLYWEKQQEFGFRGDLPPTSLSREERDQAETLFGPTADRYWTGHGSLPELAQDVATLGDDEFERNQIEGLMAVALTWSASMTTATGLANQSHRQTGHRLNTPGEVLTVNYGASYSQVAYALHTASTAFHLAVDSVVQHFAPDMDDEVRRSGAFLWRAWKDPDELAELKDDDPCPCDRPGTLWGECHKWTEDLGTTRYKPFTDADLPSFTQSEPGPASPLLPVGPIDQPSDAPEGPVVLTFTFRLPFTLGLRDFGSQRVFVLDNWKDPDDIGHFGRWPWVRMRLHNHPVDGFDIWPKHADSALGAFYGEIDPYPVPIIWGEGMGAYEQWVSIETPSGRLTADATDDLAYAFHRSIGTFNLFLTALHLVLKDARIFAVTTQEIGPVVFRGAYDAEGRWTRLGDLLMHPEALPYSQEPKSFTAIERAIDSIFTGLRDGRPFTVANLWYGRALRAARYRGDYGDCVVSLQTAAESMMFDLWRGLMVDLGKKSDQIRQRLQSELPYRTLVVRELATLLGGNWDLTSTSPVARYWKGLYLLRNKVVHAGYVPTPREADDAREAFVDVREYVNKLLWNRHKRFPRTLLAKVGENGLVRRGWMSGPMQILCEQFLKEPRPYYWPADMAGR